MIRLVLYAFVAGFVVAIPPGAVTVVAGQRALQFGFRNSLLFSLGSCVADIFYLLVVYFGISWFFTDNPLFRMILYFFCGALLLYFGITAVVNPHGIDLKTGGRKKMESGSRTILSGIGITLLNPVTIVGWIAIGGNFFLMWDKAMPEAKGTAALLIPVIMLGVMAWFGPLLFFMSKLKHFLKEKVQKILIVAAGVFLLCFAAWSVYSGISELLTGIENGS
jgi:threonine/homoserine/homoserine lactone efflux protein